MPRVDKRQLFFNKYQHAFPALLDFLSLLANMNGQFFDRLCNYFVPSLPTLLFKWHPVFSGSFKRCSTMISFLGRPLALLVSCLPHIFLCGSFHSGTFQWQPPTLLPGGRVKGALMALAVNFTTSLLVKQRWKHCHAVSWSFGEVRSPGRSSIITWTTISPAWESR